MTKIAYVKRKFADSSLNIIEKANEIIENYQDQGFTLTLRQLYYQFVSRDLIANKMSEYKRLASIINDARLAGLIDWEAIEDRTRNLQTLSHWESPADIIKTCASQYKVNKWENQEYRPEVWIEKDALLGVIEDICEEHDVPYFSCRGYTSQSEVWRAGMRFKKYSNNGQIPIIIHLGDHDPSGIDMTRDIQDRLEIFMGGMDVERIALNSDQVETYKPPPNPTKLTDSRATTYIAQFGKESWELDALEPQVIIDLINKTILNLKDDILWQGKVEEENEAKQKLNEIVINLEDE